MKTRAAAARFPSAASTDVGFVGQAFQPDASAYVRLESLTYEPELLCSCTRTRPQHRTLDVQIGNRKRPVELLHRALPVSPFLNLSPRAPRLKLFVLGNAHRPGVKEETERLLPFLREHCEILLIDLFQEQNLQALP